MTPQDRGCIRLFQVGGISVLLHWSWFVVGIIELTVRADTYPSLAWNAAEYLVLFGIVLLHEFGHAFACRQVGGTAERIVLWPLGGVAYVNPPPRPGAVLWSIAAGPLVNVLLVPVTLGLALLVPRVVPPPLAAQVAAFCNAVVVVNLLLLVFNLLPIYPLDGGQILHALLWFVIGRARSLMVCSAIGVLGAAALALYALSTGSIWLIVIAAFLGIRAVAGIQIARSLAWRDPAGHLLSGAIAGAQDGDVAKALADCDRALEIIPAGNPFAAHAYAVRAQLRAKQGEHDRAVADYGEALRLLPRAAAYRIHRGHCRACLGDYDGAEKDYREALELDRRSVTALNEARLAAGDLPRLRLPGRRGSRRVCHSGLRVEPVERAVLPRHARRRPRRSGGLRGRRNLAGKGTGGSGVPRQVRRDGAPPLAALCRGQAVPRGMSRPFPADRCSPDSTAPNLLSTSSRLVSVWIQAETESVPFPNRCASAERMMRGSDPVDVKHVPQSAWLTCGQYGSPDAREDGCLRSPRNDHRGDRIGSSHRDPAQL